MLARMSAYHRLALVRAGIARTGAGAAGAAGIARTGANILSRALGRLRRTCRAFRTAIARASSKPISG